MRKKNKINAQYIGLIAGLVFSFCIPYNVKATTTTTPSYKLRSITIASTGSIEPTVSYPYLRLLKWFTPTTDCSLIYRYITLTSGATFDMTTLSSIKKRLIALPYFKTVSITRKTVDESNDPVLSDLIIETKDRFPITVHLSLNEGPLLTITHNNAWGYGHSFSHQLFLKKRWGYGLAYELPRLHGSYFAGGQYYKQIDNNYRFNHQNVWASILCMIKTKDPCVPYYWVAGLSGSKKIFSTPATTIKDQIYQNYTFVLGKIGWVADNYTTIRGGYKIHTLERLPSGGSIELLYGYQDGSFNNRHYIGISCIKNIANHMLRYLHISCKSGGFIQNKTLEEAILKLALAYVGPPIQTCNGTRQFIDINYITGYRMPKQCMLGIRRRDPEVLAPPDNDNSMQEPIHSRLNVNLDSTLHIPITIHPIRFVSLGFVHFIALYNQNNVLLNQTWVDKYGIGLQLEHATIALLSMTFKIGYSPLLGKVFSSIQVTMRHFKNKTDPKPTVVSYN